MKRQFQNLFIISAIIAYLIFSHSCANPGAGPGGGPKDTIPPTIINMVPAPYATNVTSNEISIIFNEYVTQDNLNTKMVVSPPLAEKPTIRLKGKTLHIKFGEDLIPDRTYSVDLKDGIRDYNEGNKIESIRMLFSTYASIDTLQIKGYLLDANTLSPIKDAYATLYTSPTDILLENFPKIKNIYSTPDSLGIDSLFATQRPDFIAKTDENGFFLFDNLPAGRYKLYGLTDIDNNLMFTQQTEQIAFIDSLIVPTATYVVSADTIIQENDTIVNTGHTEFMPDPVFAYMFTEEQYNQFITDSKRESRDKILITFNESLTDSFKVELAKINTVSDWKYTEFSQERDSVSIWLTDTTLIQNDSLFLKVSYTALDTLDKMVTTIDTLRAFFVDPVAKGKPKKKDELENKIASFEFKSNIKANNFDLNIPILVEAQSPIESMDTSMVHLKIEVNDSVYEAVPFDMMPVEGSKRKYQLDYKPAESSKYILLIDSAEVKTLSGLTNLAVESVFKTQKADYYGTATFEITGIDEEAYLMLLKNSDKEDIVKMIKLEPGQKSITFDYLKPGKYRVKIFVDKNHDGKWSAGNLVAKQQPERVYYFPKVINIKSFWDLKENWNIDPKVHTLKKIEDEDKKKDEE